jgi:hypothetical protein
VKHRKSRVLVASFVAGAVFFSSAQAAVLCTGADGHVAVEFAFHHHCEEGGLHDSAGERGHEHGLAGGLRECNSCEDEGLGRWEISLSKAKEAADADAPPCFGGPAAEQSENWRGACTGASDCFSSYFSALDAVVLII